MAFIKHRNYIWLVLVVICTGTFIASSQAAKNTGKTVSVGTIQFLIPEDFHAVYTRGEIHFAIDANTFQIIKDEGGPEDKRRTVRVSVEESNTHFGEQNFWPHPLERNDVLGCDSYKIKNHAYDLCQYDRQDEIIPIWGDEIFFLRDNNKTDPILVIGCGLMHTTPNPQCVSLGLILDKIQIRYSYSIQYLENAFLIDQAIRRIVTHFHNLAQEKN